MTLKTITVPDIPGPRAQLCYAQAETMARCDRKKRHKGRHSWEPALEIARLKRELDAEWKAHEAAIVGMESARAERDTARRDLEQLRSPANAMKAWVLIERRLDGTEHTIGIALTSQAASEWVRRNDVEGEARTSLPFPVIDALDSQGRTP